MTNVGDIRVVIDTLNVPTNDGGAVSINDKFSDAFASATTPNEGFLASKPVQASGDAKEKSGTKENWSLRTATVLLHCYR